ncbi:MAG: hypothetical protein PF961_01415 [Planctomycetota bacterium]|jgi:hypothetical protein|nr:hypothetical protein [Planctomycetota bacterium]
MINVIAHVERMRTELAKAAEDGTASRLQTKLLPEFEDAVQLLIKCYEHGVRGSSQFAEMDDNESVWVSSLQHSLNVTED